MTFLDLSIVREFKSVIMAVSFISVKKRKNESKERRNEQHNFKLKQEI